MSATRKGLASASMLLVLGLGCGSGERPKAEPAPPAEPPAVAAPSPPAESPPVELQPSSDELPVEEDFEAEAEQQISAENLRAELDAIERELAAAQ